MAGLTLIPQTGSRSAVEAWLDGFVDMRSGAPAWFVGLKKNFTPFNRVLNKPGADKPPASLFSVCSMDDALYWIQPGLSLASDS